MAVNVLGASIGKQWIDGDPDLFEWLVNYERNGGGRFYHTVSSDDAQGPTEAVEVAKRQLGQNP